MIRTAQSSSACPLCSTWIAAKRSKVIELPEPMHPRCNSYGTSSLDDGLPYFGGGISEEGIRRTPKRLIHWYCAPRYGTEPAYAEGTAGLLYQVRPTVETLSGRPRPVTLGRREYEPTIAPGHTHPMPSTASQRRSCPKCRESMALWAESEGQGRPTDGLEGRQGKAPESDGTLRASDR